MKNMFHKSKFFVLLVLALVSITSFAGCNTGSEVPSSDLLPEKSNTYESSENPLTKSDEFDDVLASGGGYNIVIKTVETFDNVYDMIGVVSDEGEWIQKLSKEHPFITDGKVEAYCKPSEDGNSARIEASKASIFYIEDGMFLLTNWRSMAHTNSGIVYNAKENIGFNVGEYGSGMTVKPSTYFNDGYWVVTYDHDRYIKIIDESGNIEETDIRLDLGNFGQYSEGVFYASGGRFYDIDLNLVIDLSQYNIISSCPSFKDGKCYLMIKNPNGVKYETEIDHSGKFIYEPRKID